jgi:4-hydroxybenzoate polyprenyltransferase
MFIALIKSMRPRQWTKNIFLLAAIVFDRKLFEIRPLLLSLGGFFAFCLLSSAVYIFNDILDIKGDRQHPDKCKRPIASGKLPIPVAIIAGVVLATLALGLAAWLSFSVGSYGFLIIAGIYLIVILLYSMWLKHIPLLDVLIVASGFDLRVAAGAALIQVPISPWLYIIMTLFALYLGFGKRRAELALLAKDAGTHRKVLDGYTIPLLDQLITIVSGTTIVSYSLYTFLAQNTVGEYYIMLTIPFVVYGIFRYLYLIQVKNAGGAPEELVLSDRPLQIAIGLWAMSVIFVYYVLPRLLKA